MAGYPVSNSGTATGAAQRESNGGKLYLAFSLGGSAYSIEIERIREIIEYDTPTAVPMMPAAVCGVINLRGAVVPVLDLAVRFGRGPIVVSRRSCYVIVEVEYEEAMHVIGLLVDRVTAVVEIDDADIEPPPAFGAQIDVDFIAGLARHENRFLIILNVARALSIAEMSAVARMEERDLRQADLV
ncbi:chemotaxis protein CheW [Chromobacterium paludis]|uniref:Purine-binding chemotaxis protein CheW n=1 Tax=Chromobacterium paludis TaxID=2605945 RepID=A0A5C1DHC4_9NEIS|nr:chemotaxis protein CheW [Chromobacterium paludis]QEL56104.1 purine-binding chemotaxis protein CheW [Chromobacterium paludis]